ncbi:MAG: EEP domain-containing protein [Gammaproteobacteria bacterium]|jgi:endonuclease/exonuclease/phosphatase family metal-dependent hydrolase|nr:EEP domain-containing protein [Gammaproteobacteria bacterium]
MSTTTSGSASSKGLPPHDVHPDRRLRLLSYNIQTGISYHHYGHYLTRSWRHLMPHGTRRKNLDGIAGCLDAYDVVALQESDAGSLRTGFTNQTEYLARQSCFPYWLDQTNRHLGHFAKHSNGLLSRFRPHSIVRHRLPGLPGRGALVAEIGRSHGSLAIFVLHLALGRATRLRQMGYLAELVNEFEQVIFMGDLNCDPWSPEMRLLTRETRLQAPTRYYGTYPSWRPRRRIDYILVTPEIHIRRSFVPPWRYSDHLPIAMEVTLPEPI